MKLLSLVRHILVSSLCCAACGVASAATFNIPNGDVAALKNAINLANSNGQADIINLASNGTYTLTAADNTFSGVNGLPVINDDAPGLDLTLNGNGATIGRSTGPGTPEFRILMLNLNASVSCNNLTIARGSATGAFPASRGGGILLITQATLTLTNCTVRDNTAIEAGGIWNSQGALTLNGSLISSNTATRGGGIYNLEGTVSGSGSTFSDNIANGVANTPGLGGAIYNVASNLPASTTLSGCQFTGNRITGEGIGHGGAIDNRKQNNSAASLVLTNCVFSANHGEEATGGAITNEGGAITLSGGSFDHNSARHGGAIEHGFGMITMRGVTFSANSAIRNNMTNTGGLGGAILLTLGGTLSVSDSAFTGNEAGDSGGAIYNSGTLTITNSDFNANVANFFGGAIRNDNALSLSNSRVLSNTSNSFGGGILNTSSVTVERCTINTNTSGAAGGIGNSGTLSVESSTLDGNKAQGAAAEGGAIGMLQLSPAISTAIRNSTLSNNLATRGGGVFNLGTLTVMNVTLSGNSATGDGGALYNRGKSGIYAATFFGNNAANGGGVYNTNSGTNAEVVLSSTILRSGSSGANLVKASGDIFSYGFNLSNDSAGGDASTGPGGLLGNTGDIRNTDPNLGPLQENGGPTKTHALNFPSAAIEAGDDKLTDAPFSLTSDQRGPGFPRRIGARLDMGAFESGTIFTVTTTQDQDDGACTPSHCSLREALTAANAAGPCNISFASGVSGIIQLGGALPTIGQNLSLGGPGANLLTVRRNSGGDYRIFTISNGTASGPSVTLRGLTLANGRAPALMFPNDSGGGILNDRGSLSVESCALLDNSTATPDSSFGGGIFNHEGSLSVRQSTIAGNTAHSGGGVASRITAGHPHFVDLRNSTISGNSATGGDGGGVWSFASSAGSRADVELATCTVSGNSASASGFSGGAGGAIYNAGFASGEALMALEDCTIANNSATNTGGMYNSNFGGTARIALRNTLLKRGAFGGNFLNSNGEIVSLGHNLSDDEAGDASNPGSGPSGYLNAAGDIRNTDPQLGPLAENGGLTRTHALSGGSPAINAGENTGFNYSDQRDRLRRGTNDIGAFEFNAIHLRITSVARSGNDAVVSFDGAAGLTFQLQRKLAPSDDWQEISGVDAIEPANDGIAQFVDPGAFALGRALYRVELLVE